MKNHFILFVFLILGLGCREKNMTPMEVAMQYYKGFETGNFTLVTPIIGDSLMISSGDYHTPYSQNGFYEFFKWDSVFQPTYELRNLEAVDDGIVATVTVHSIRYAFLKNNPLTYKHKISLASGKILNIQDLGSPGADWDTWTRERDSLVQWISVHHPELDGFIYDLSMNGAIQYVKAIELYENRKNTFTPK